MADNFEQLGFQVEVGGADSAVSHLDEIIERLKQIQALQGNTLKGRTSKKTMGLATSSQIMQEDLAKAQAKGVKDNYNLALKYARQYAQITDPTYKRVYDMGLQVKNLKKQIEQSNYLTTSSTTNATTSINKTKTAIDKKVNSQKKEEQQTKKTTKSLTSYIAKLTSVVVIARRFAHFLTDAVNESAKYIENLNLFAVAFGDTYEETIDWALNIADAYGLASNEVVRFAGTFRQLSTSLGLVEDTANAVSKTVTQLGYDMSALFNTTVENAMEKLQSGIFSGNVRPLRSYGIDISQNQINALFETNQTLSSLGANARNLSQSDKVLARLIITLRDGSNAFGTMSREINTLQSQIRIFQGSLSNFKLAIGDLLYEPMRRVLIVVNAFLIAMTNVIRAFKPLQRQDKNNMINGVAMGAEEANEEIDELNGKLADFDKFNVLGGQSNTGTSDAVTEALTAELQRQQELYEEQLALMGDIENEAKELAKALEPIAVVLAVIFATWSVAKIKTILTNITAVNAKISLTNTLIVGGLIWAIAKAIEAFREGEWAAGIFATTLAVILAGAFIYLNNTAIIGLWQTIGKKLIPVIMNAIASFGGLKAALLSVASSAVTGGIAFMGAWAILSIIPSGAQKIVGGIMAIAGAFIALTTAILAYQGVLSWGTALPALTAVIGVAIAGGMAYKGQIKQIGSFADGGYTNANLIMTHENGKREWVGKAAGSSAIVNDTQMSDIMEVAVAKGVYRAMSAEKEQSRSSGTTKNIYKFNVNGREILTAFEEQAGKQGKFLSRNRG